METKFTKGEWMVSSDTEIVSMPSHCKISNCISGWSYQEAEANAKLIAAAPKMFSALDFLANMEEETGYSGYTYGDTNYDSEAAAYGYNKCLEYVKSIAEKAIKKATK